MLKPRFWFATIKFPYKFKGVSPSHNNNIHNYAQTLFGGELQEGFIFAYQNLLESLVSPDAEEFLRENCDQKIGQSFLQGLGELKKNKQELKLRYNDQCKENLMYDTATLHLFFNPNQDLSDQKPILSQKAGGSVSMNLYDQMRNMSLAIPCPSSEFSVFIRSPCYLSINNEEFDNQLYHRVVFRTLTKQTVGLMKLQELTQKAVTLMQADQNSIDKRSAIIKEFIGQDYTWIISDFDGFLRQNQGK